MKPLRALPVLPVLPAPPPASPFVVKNAPLPGAPAQVGADGAVTG